MELSLLSQLRALDDAMQSICSATGSPGLSIGVAQAGSIIHTAHYGYRDVEKGLLVDPDTAYGIASLTKSFVASAMGILVDEGKVSWTTPVKNILPELDTQDALTTEQLSVADLSSAILALRFPTTGGMVPMGSCCCKRLKRFPFSTR